MSARKARAAAVEHFTDLAAAERLAADYRDRLRHVRGIGYLAWDGKRWAPGGDDAHRAAKANAVTLLREAAENGDPRRAASAARLCGEPRIRGALALAATDELISVSPDRLDADPWLLNAANGVIDLRDGTLKPHRRELYMTKLAGAEYREDARSDRWETHISRSTGGDVEFAAYLQRAAGYAATGSGIEEVALFAHGPGNTGKTATLEALRAALGDYAIVADFATFLAGRRDGDAPTPGVARLKGARMVCASEVDDGQRFNPARLKRLTGGERVTARPLYHEAFEFDPAFTLWFSANERPAIAANDSAAWRRLRLLPFIHVIPETEIDKDFKQALIEDPADRAAVLTWIVSGAVMWRQEGLGHCPTVDKATAGYRSENDPLHDWFETCQFGDDLSTPGGQLRANYERWCRQFGEQACSPKDFAAALEERELIRKRPRSGSVWHGIAVADEAAVTGETGNSPKRARIGTSRKGLPRLPHLPHADADGAGFLTPSPAGGVPSGADGEQQTLRAGEGDEGRAVAETPGPEDDDPFGLIAYAAGKHREAKR